MYAVDFDEKPRHFFGSIEQRLNEPLEYPFFSENLDSPAIVLLRFRVSRIDSATTLIANQKALCKELSKDASTSPNAASDFLYSIQRLLELVQESIARSSSLNEDFLSKPEFSQYRPDIAVVLRDSSLTAKNQVRYCVESCAMAKGLKLSKESIELTSVIKNAAELTEDLISKSPGYQFSEHFFSDPKNIEAMSSR